MTYSLQAFAYLSAGGLAAYLVVRMVLGRPHRDRHERR